MSDPKELTEHYHGHGNHSDHGNHADHHRMMIKDFRNRFYLSLVLTLPILALTPLIKELTGFGWTFSGAGYVVFLLATILYFVGGWPFLSNTES